MKYLGLLFKEHLTSNQLIPIKEPIVIQAICQVLGEKVTHCQM